MAPRFQVVFDCADPDRLATFWAAALGYRKEDPPPGFATWPDFLKTVGFPEDRWDAASAVVDPEGVGSRIFFQRVPEPKTVKNRVHLDVNAGGPRGTPDDERKAKVDAEVERLLGLGATKVRLGEEFGQRWYVMQDPEGNEFCVQ